MQDPGNRAVECPSVDWLNREMRDRRLPGQRTQRTGKKAAYQLEAIASGDAVL